MPRPKPAPRNKSAKSAHAGNNLLRIIGGRWRSRKLPFPNLPGLRPTPDRVRETLFNWLAPVIPGAHCLDLFAGSGALGLEALSRNAASVTLVDSATEVTQTLKQHLTTLAARDARVINQSAISLLQSASTQAFDVVFIDPPFGQGLAECVIDLLSPHLSDQAWVYLEMGCDEPLPALPARWQLYREKQAGQVCYRLFQCQPST